VLRQGVQGISDLVVQPGIVNVDFADIRAIMHDAGSAMMGIGIASGEERAMDAARNAINSPLLDLSIDGARGVLFSVAGGDDLAMSEVNDAAKIITDSINPDAKVIFGAVIDERVKKGTIKITVIATGFAELPIKATELDYGAPTEREEVPVRQTAPEQRRPAVNIPEKEEKEQKQEPPRRKDDDDDTSGGEPDWDIPAFIRKKMR
jgi:cell division protein FtsZ